MNSVTDYLKISNDEENRPLIDNYKKELSYRLIRRDLEIAYKEIEFCKLIGEINFYSKREDELLGVTVAMCLLLNCREEDICREYQELIIEGLCFGFFDLTSKDKKITTDTIDKYARAFSELLFRLAINEIIHPDMDKNHSFFQEFNTYFPEQEVQYFINNYNDFLLPN
jgi:hypothetical protein